MSSSRSGKLSSVLARFEETIEQNNVAGVCSGMYLTNQASTRKPKHATTAPRRHPPIKKGGSNRRLDCSMGSLQRLEAGVYRNILKNTDATVSTAETTEADEWDPFNDANADALDDSMSSFGNSSFASLNDDSPTTVRKERPKDKKSAGRRNNRVSKSKKSRKDASRKEHVSQKGSLPSRNEEEEEDDGDQSDNNDDGGFALTYVSARDKFTALTKQNSDRQLCKQPSRRKLLSGLKMTSKENVLSTSSNHSSSSRTPACKPVKSLLPDRKSNNGAGGRSNRKSSRNFHHTKNDI